MTIKELREKYNLTQSALARSLGVSSNAISGIEAGRIKLSPKMTAKIKEVYGEEVEAPTPAEKTAPAKKEAALKKAEKPAKKEAAEKAVVTAPTAASAPEKKDTVEPAKAVATEKPNEASVAPTAAPAPVKKAPEKKEAKKAAKKATKKGTAPVEARVEKKAAPSVILQSPFGGEITAEEILSKVGEAEKIYVRIDQNKAYWVKGEENGDVDLW